MERPADPNPDIAEILRLEAVLVAGWGRPPTPEIEALVADEFGFWSVSGVRRDRAAFLAVIGAGAPDGETRIDEAHVRVVGDAAVYAARVTDVPSGDGAAELRTCVTDVFARRDGRWQLIASHESIVADAASD